MDQLSSGLILAALTGAPATAEAGWREDLPLEMFPRDLGFDSIAGCVSNVMEAQPYTLPDMHCAEGNVTLDVTTEQIPETMDSLKLSESRKWTVAQTKAGEKCAATTVFIPGYAELLMPLRHIEQALAVEQAKFPDQNVCAVVFNPVGRGTGEYIDNQKYISGVTFEDMIKETLDLAKWSLAEHPEWYAGEIILLGHSLGEVYAEHVAEYFLDQGVDLTGFINANGVPSNAYAALNAQLLLNVKGPFPETMLRAITHRGATELSTGFYDRRMGDLDEAGFSSLLASGPEFTGWGLAPKDRSRDAEFRMAEAGVNTVTAISANDRLIPDKMVKRALRGDHEALVVIPNSKHGMGMSMAWQDKAAWRWAFDAALNGYEESEKNAPDFSQY